MIALVESMPLGELVFAIFLLGMIGFGLLILFLMLVFAGPIDRMLEKTKCTQCGKEGRGSLGQLVRHDEWRDVGPIDPFGYAIAVCPDHFIHDRSGEKRMGSFSSPYEIER